MQECLISLVHSLSDASPVKGHQTDQGIGAQDAQGEAERAVQP